MRLYNFLREAYLKVNKPLRIAFLILLITTIFWQIVSDLPKFMIWIWYAVASIVVGYSIVMAVLHLYIGSKIDRD